VLPLDAAAGLHACDETNEVFVRNRTQWLLFFLAFALMGAALAMHESVFNNFLDDVYHLGADARGRLEFPRELPGFLVVVMSAMLCALAVTRVAVVAALGFALGMAGMAWWGMAHYPLMLAMMLLASAGMHLLQPVGASIVIALTGPAKRGRVMGLMDALGTVGTVAGALLVMLFFSRPVVEAAAVPGAVQHPPYASWFLASGGVACAAAFCYGRLHVPALHSPRARFVFRRRYALYYGLELLFGARKQIFITFGPWVLVKVYQAVPADIARLIMTAALIGLVFKPAAGWAIDRWGERTVLIADGLLLSVVCLGYGYALWIAGDIEGARRVASMCFVADSLLFALGSGRAIYLSRLTDSPQEVNSTLSMGISINHIVSMAIPTFAGAMWVAWGYERVFAAAAGLALLNAVAASFVPRREPRINTRE